MATAREHVDEKGVRFTIKEPTDAAAGAVVTGGSSVATGGAAAPTQTIHTSGTGWLMASASAFALPSIGVRTMKKPSPNKAAGGNAKTSKNKKLTRMYSSAATQKEAALRREEIQESEEETQDRFQWFRTWVVLVWMGVNCMLLFVARSADASGATVLKVTLFVVTVINCFRFTGSMVFLAMSLFERWQRKLFKK
jgi:hypothetical protein